MRKLILLFSIPIFGSDSEPSTPIPTESPAHMIAEGCVEGAPQLVHIVSECLGDHKTEATAEIVGCFVSQDSAARKVVRGSYLCCLRCKKKKS